MKLIHVISLGCPKNLVDSEQILGILGNAGYAITSAPEEAEVIIINTCGFINPAVRESLDVIIRCAEWKRRGNCRLLVVTGCLPQRYGSRLAEKFPEVDLWLGVQSAPAILQALEQVGKEGRLVAGSFSREQSPGNFPRLLTTPPAVAYLKIAEGCNHSCSFCMIPGIRGRLVSKPPEQIYREAGELAAGGVKELILVAQDTGSYGRDLPGSPTLASLLRGLAAVDGVEWLRILYMAPDAITPDLIDLIATEPKVCHYLDIPFQHASRKILKLMGRRGELWSYLTLIDDLRRRIPDLTLRTTLMTGFPGEEEDDFEELLTFVELVRFDRIGVFPYYCEQGSRAARLGDPVPHFLKRRRRAEVMALQRQISRHHNEQLVGSTLTVLIEEQLGQGVYRGRSYRDAPEIDPQVIVNGEGLTPGHFAEVTITTPYTLDLAGIAR